MTMRSWIRKVFTRPVTRTIRKASRRVSLAVMELEDRCCPSTFTVTNTLDDGSVGSLRWAIVNSEAHTNGGTGNDIIQFSAAIDGKTISLSPQITNQVAAPSAFVISSDTLLIDGQTGLSLGITISANADTDYSFRIFDVTATGELTLKGLTLSGGHAQGGNGGTANGEAAGGGGGSAGLGGAIFNQGRLTIFDSTLTGNTAQGGSGGGSNNMINSAGGGAGGGGINGGGLLGPGGNGGGATYAYGGGGGGPDSGSPGAPGLSPNGTAGGFGGGGGGGFGGLFPLTNIDQTGSGAPGGFGGGGGGGASHLYRDYSVIPDTAAQGEHGGAGGFGGGGGGGGGTEYVGGGGDGGGGFGGGNAYLGNGGGGAGMGGAVFNEGGAVTITNSTFTGNTAVGGAGGSGVTGFRGGENGDGGGGFGGGVFNHNGSLIVLNSTFSLNTAADGGRDVMSLGDSVYNTASFTTAIDEIYNTILGQSDTAVQDFTARTLGSGGNSTSGDGNLIRTQSGFTGAIASTADPLLGPLHNNGGTTWTMALSALSPAIDRGDKSHALTTDQRGKVRDFDQAGTVDIGAYEAPVGFNMVVNTAADDTTPDGTLSLREALDLANGTLSFSALTPTEKLQVTPVVGASTITFASSLDGSTLTLSTVGDASVGPSAFLVNSQVVIDGPSGNSGITLSATGTTMRFFDVASSGDLTLQDLTLSSGDAQGFAGGSATYGGAGGGSAGLGGAIFNQGSLTIISSTLTGNTAQGGAGGSFQYGLPGYVGAGGAGLGGAGGGTGGFQGGAGGIPNGGAGGFGLSGSPNGGGGLFGGGGGGGFGLGSTGSGGIGGVAGFGGGGGGGGLGVSGGGGGAGGFGGGGGGGVFDGGGAGGYGGGNANNRVGAGGGAGMGGAVFNEAGTVVITNSTFTDNMASGGAGGRNSFSTSSASAGQGLGGGLFNHNGTLTVTNSTFSLNTAAQGGRGIFILGDGRTATAVINNTIIGQSDTSVSDLVVNTLGTGSATVSGASNLIRTTTYHGVSNNILNALQGDPLLGPLQNNGGPTHTIGLLPGSPAIDQKIKGGALTTDQRGVARDPDHAGTADIGAYELVGLVANMVVNTAADDTTPDGTLSLREALDLANGTLSFSALTALEKLQVTPVAGTVSTITFASILDGNTFTLSTVGDDRVGPSAFVIDTPVAIDGPSGNSGITLSAAGTTMRLFDVTSSGNLTLQNLTLSGGDAQGFAGGNASDAGAGGGSAGLGGAIFNQGSLTILDSTLTGNTAQGGVGGSYQRGLVGSGGAGGAGLGAVGGAESSIYGSAGGAPNGGEGLGVYGFSGGLGFGGGFGGGGGGGGGNFSSIFNSDGGGGGFGGGGGGNAFGNNVGGSVGSDGYGGGGFGGGGGGGGFHGGGFGGGNGNAYGHGGGGGGGGAGMGGAVFNEAGTVVIIDSTLTDNAAVGGASGTVPHSGTATAGSGLGGGLFNHNGTLTVTNSTFSLNTAAQGGQGIINLGDSASRSATATITNTIIGQPDTSVSDLVVDQLGGGSATVSGVTNLIRTTSVLNGATNHLTGTLISDPLLDTRLLNNGGPTLTLALLATSQGTSPAINAGNAAGAPSTDQRGLNRVGNVDIGAFEDQFLFQTITFGPLTEMTYGHADFALSATTTSGLPVSFTAIGNAIVKQIANVWYVQITGAGSATITAHQVGNGSYNPALDLAQSLTIDKADAVFVVTPYTVTYDGLSHTATVTSITGVNGETGSVVGTVNLSTTNTNAGTYASDSWSFIGTANYNDIAATPITDVINKATATVVVTPYTVTYDGSPHTATASITGVNGQTGAAVGTVTSTPHTNAGTYATDSWSFTAANYNNIAATTIIDVINQASSTTTTVGAGPFTYTGSAHGGSGRVTGAGTITGSATVSYSAHADGTGVADQIDVGTYYVTAHYAGDANHTASDGTAVAIIINKASSTTTTVGAGPFTYTGSARIGGSGRVTGAGTITGSATVSYSAHADGTGVADQIDVGTYYVTAHYAGDANHTASDGAAVAIVIDPSQTWIVNTTSNSLAPEPGLLSLPEAILLANADASFNTITFDPTVFATPQTIILGGSQLELSDTTALQTITGPAAGVTVSGDGLSRVFQVDAGVSASFSGLTITDGSANSSRGGGIYNVAGTLTLTNCTVSGNSANGGGGLFNAGTLTLTDSTVGGNSAQYGGGLDNRSGTATLTNCTVSGNSANYFNYGKGGGIYNVAGTVTLTNCTISGNSAHDGGGLYNRTIHSTDVFQLSNTIVAGNYFLARAPKDVYGTFTSLGNNLIGSTDFSTGWVSSDRTGTYFAPLNALLAPLGDYGGPTWTRALLLGSPAIDAGSSGPGIPTTDQRGFARFGATDIGAFEYHGANVQPQNYVVNTTSDALDPGPGLTSLPLAIQLANYDGVASTITFDPTVFASVQKITLTGTQLELSDTTSQDTIIGPAVGVTIDGGNLGPVFQIDAGVTASISGLTITDGLSSTSTVGSALTIDPNAALTLANCTISGNHGLGVLIDGTATLTNCTISGNTSSTIGGIRVFGGTATLNNCTISGNTGNNGGIVAAGGSTVTLTNCTVSGNTGTTTGGISNNGGTIRLLNTIVARNTGPTNADVTGIVTSLGNNLIGTTGTSTGWVSSDLTGTNASLLNPQLGTLANNGGPTQTMALLAGSLAINAGNAAGAPSTDQRGYSRVGNVDIGAFEFGGVPRQSQTITFGSLTAVTYGDADFALSATTTSGLPVSFTASGNAAVYENIGTGVWYVQIGGAGSATITAHQAGDGSYDAALDVAQSLTIGKASSTTTTVGAAPFTYDITSHSGGSGTVTGAGSLSTVATSLTYTGDQIDAGTYYVTAHYAGDANHTASDGLAVAIVINQASSTTTTAGAGPFVYDTTSHSGGSGTVTGAGGLSTGATSLTYSGDQIDAGTYYVTAHYAGDANHTASDGLAVAITIDQASSATTTVGAGPFTYDGTSQTGGSGTVTGAGIITGSATLTYTGDQIDAGTYYVTAHYAGDSNHTASDGLAVAITIDQASSTTTTVGAGAFTYDGTSQTGGSSIVTGAGIITGSATLTYTGDQIDAGTYYVTAHYAGDSNHTASDGLAVAITIDQASSTTTTGGAGPFTYDTTSHSGGSGTVTGAGGLSTGATSLTYSGDQIDAGTYYVTAHYAGDSNHTASDGAAGAIVIKQATASITITPYSVTYDGSPHMATVMSITGVNGETGAAVGTVTLKTTHTNAGTYSDSWSFTAANYNNISTTTIADSIAQVATTVVVTINGGPFTYTGLAQTPSTVLVTGAGLSLTPAAIYANNVNAGTATASYTYAGDANHTGSSDSKSFTITPAPLTITANDQSTSYGSALPTLTVGYTVFVNGDTSTDLSTLPTATTTATAASGPGTYAIAVGGAASANYTIRYSPGTLTIVPAVLSVVADDFTRLAGRANPVLTFTWSGFVPGQTSSVLSGQPTLSTTATPASPAGVYAIIVSQDTLSASNYTFRIIDGTLTVTALPVAVSGPGTGAVIVAPVSVGSNPPPGDSTPIPSVASESRADSLGLPRPVIPAPSVVISNSSPADLATKAGLVLVPLSTVATLPANPNHAAGTLSNNQGVLLSPLAPATVSGLLSAKLALDTGVASTGMGSEPETVTPETTGDGPVAPAGPPMTNAGNPSSAAQVLRPAEPPVGRSVVGAAVEMPGSPLEFADAGYRGMPSGAVMQASLADLDAFFVASGRNQDVATGSVAGALVVLWTSVAWGREDLKQCLQPLPSIRWPQKRSFPS